MNPITLLMNFLKSLGSDAAQKAAPFALEEITAVSGFVYDVAATEFDLRLSPGARMILHQTEVNDLKILLATFEEKGIQLAYDIPGLLLSAGGDQIVSIFTKQ